jgi:hypothetical protein
MELPVVRASTWSVIVASHNPLLALVEYASVNLDDDRNVVCLPLPKILRRSAQQILSQEPTARFAADLIVDCKGSGGVFDASGILDHQVCGFQGLSLYVRPGSTESLELVCEWNGHFARASKVLHIETETPLRCSSVQSLTPHPGVISDPVSSASGFRFILHPKVGQSLTVREYLSLFAKKFRPLFSDLESQFASIPASVSLPNLTLRERAFRAPFEALSNVTRVGEKDPGALMVIRQVAIYLTVWNHVDSPSLDKRSGFASWFCLELFLSAAAKESSIEVSTEWEVELMKHTRDADRALLDMIESDVRFLYSLWLFDPSRESEMRGALTASVFSRSIEKYVLLFERITQRKWDPANRSAPTGDRTTITRMLEDIAVLSHVTRTDKIGVSAGRIEIMRSGWFTFLWRRIFGENRIGTVGYLENLLQSVCTVLSISDEASALFLRSQLRDAVRGIDALQETYASDTAQVEILKGLSQFASEVADDCVLSLSTTESEMEMPHKTIRQEGAEVLSTASARSSAAAAEEMIAGEAATVAVSDATVERMIADVYEEATRAEESAEQEKDTGETVDEFEGKGTRPPHHADPSAGFHVPKRRQVKSSSKKRSKKHN